MRTDSACLPCFLKQAEKTACLSGCDTEGQGLVAQKVGSLLQKLDMSLSPPENAVRVYSLIAELTGIRDPYSELRRQSNQLALGMRDYARDRIKQSNNPLTTAIQFSVAANIIDYGTLHDFDAVDVLSKCLQKNFIINDGEQLISALTDRKECKVLYLADNSGEIVFDGLLVEELRKLGCLVTVAVREEQILNDATRQDAVMCGLDHICQVITNGTGCPGTPLMECSNEFRAAFNHADLVISKGQGNFETLSEVEAPIYFLLTVKCSVVGRHIEDMNKYCAKGTIAYGDTVLMRRGE